MLKRKKKTVRRIGTFMGFLIIGFALIVDAIQFLCFFFLVTGILIPIGLAITWFSALIFTISLTLVLKLYHMPIFTVKRITQFILTIIAETVPVLGNMLPSLTIWAFITLRTNRKMVEKDTAQRKAEAERNAKILMRYKRLRAMRAQRAQQEAEIAEQAAAQQYAVARENERAVNNNSRLTQAQQVA